MLTQTSFEIYFLPHVPFLNPLTSTKVLVERCPLYFWTLMLLASRRNHAHQSLYERLCMPLDRLLSGLAITSMGKVEDVHALLLLAQWPTPRLRRVQDPGWTYVGVAISNALNMGLHRPVVPAGLTSDWRGFGDFTPADFSVETRVSTWLGCFVIGTQ